MTPDTEPRMSAFRSLCISGTAADKRNMRVLNICMVLWVVVFLGSLTLMEAYGDESLTISVAALLAAGLAWVPVVWAYLRYPRETDELVRMVHVQAMAVAFSMGFCYTLLDRFLFRVASLLPVSFGAVDFIEAANPMVMALAFAVTLGILQWRYAK